MVRGREGVDPSVWFCMGREGGSNAHAYPVPYAYRDIDDDEDLDDTYTFF